MALTPIGLGSAPNDGNGDNLRAGGAKINTGFTQTDTNETDIATNAAAIKLIQYVFQNLTAGDVINASSTVDVNTGIEVAITPMTASSKLIVSFHSDWEFAANQEGARINYEYTDDNYVTSTVKRASLYFRSIGNIGRVEISGKIEIPNTGTVNEIKCRLIFTAQTNLENTTFMGTDGAFMDVSEIKI